MKKVVKVKVCALLLMLVMSLVVIPNVFAYNAFVGAATAEAADAVISVKTEDGKTSYQPGDTVMLHVILEKVPDVGCNNVSFVLEYDSSLLQYDETKASYTTEAKELFGIAKNTNLTASKAAQVKNIIKIPVSDLSDYATAVTKEDIDDDGFELFYIAFTVKDDASGNLGFKVVNTDADAGSRGGLCLGYYSESVNKNKSFENSKVFLDTNVGDAMVEVPVEKVEATQDSIPVDKTQTSTFDISDYIVVTPENTTDTMSYESSDKSVATVAADGVVTVKGNGTTTITVKCGEKSASVDVVVTTSPTEVNFEKASYNVETGSTLNLAEKISCKPDDAQIPEMTWTSSDEKIATVDESGVVTPVGNGTATITAKSGNLQATTTVIVTVPLTDISLDKETVTIYKGESDTVVATALPEGAEINEIGFNEYDTNVITAETVGTDSIKITGLKKGNCVLTVVANEKIEKIISIEVKENKIVSLEITGEDAVYKNDTIELTAKSIAEDTSRPTTDEASDITWTSSDETIATVDEAGVVTGISAGTVTITAEINGITETKDITVKENNIVEVKLSGESTVAKGSTIKLDCATKLEDESHEATSNTSYWVWTSSDETVATVDNSGVVTGKAAGTTTITVEIDGVSDSKEITVTENKVTGVNITGIPEGEILKGDTFTITAKPVLQDEKKDPTDDTTVTITSSDESVVKVDNDGKVTAVGAGTATITVSVADVTETKEITIAEYPIEKVTMADEVKTQLAEGTIDAKVGDKIEIPVTIEPAKTTSTEEEILAFLGLDKTESVGVNAKVEIGEDGNAKIILVPTKVSSQVVIQVNLDGELGEDVVYINMNVKEKSESSQEEPSSTEENASEEEGNVDTGDVSVLGLALTLAGSVTGLFANKKRKDRK